MKCTLLLNGDCNWYHDQQSTLNAIYINQDDLEERLLERTPMDKRPTESVCLPMDKRPTQSVCSPMHIAGQRKRKEESKMLRRDTDEGSKQKE